MGSYERKERKGRKERKEEIRIFAPLALFASLALILSLLIGVLPAYAQEPTQNDVNRVANQLYCPVCENITLANCPTDACVEWRARIRDELATGRSDQQIIDGFVNDYGMRVVGAPPLPLLWVLPPIGLAAAAVFLIWLLRSWLKRPRPIEVTPELVESPEGMDEYRARLERDLREEPGR
jgi:cytochrome c-type biogenesis protein CcmH